MAVADQQSQTCPECNGTIVTDQLERRCSECGLVVSEDRIDHGPEWRQFADDEHNPERTGAPLTRSRHDRGLSTEIGSSSRLRITGRKRRQIARMRREHDRSKISSKQERNQVYGFTEIRRIVSALSLPQQVRDSACSLFRSAQKADLLKGRSVEGFAAAAIYATCRIQSNARSTEEITGPARASEAELRAAYDAINRELGLPTGPTSPQEYLPRFASELSLPEAVTSRALELARWAEADALTVGRDPTGVAAGCLYAAVTEANVDCTQTAIADVAGVSPVTLRKTYQDLTPQLS